MDTAEPAADPARAEAIARRAHAGQTDKAGRPYIGHVARVAARMAGDRDGECVAWLHDTVEDTAVTLAELAREFPHRIVAAVDAITRRDGERAADYYARVRVRGDALARAVKLADIADNSDPERLAALDKATRAWLINKYARARAALGIDHGRG